MTYKENILKTLQDNPNWVPEYYFEKVNTKYGWIGNSGGRRVRELAQAGLIERKVEKYAYVRGIPKITYKVIETSKDTVMLVPKSSTG